MIRKNVPCPCPMCEGKDGCSVFDQRNCEALKDWEKGTEVEKDDRG